MGGTIAVTLREPNGLEHRMHRWTNELPWFIKNKRFFEKDSRLIKEYLDSGDTEEMDQALAPYGYGLVVIDMVNDVILSSQGYSSLDNIYNTRVLNDLYSEGLGDLISGKKEDILLLNKNIFKSDGDESAVVRLYGLHQMGNIKEMYDVETHKKINIEKASFDTVFNFICNGQRKFIIDMAPFDYTVFKEHDLDDTIAMKNRVLELGFKLSNTEFKAWDDYIEEYRK